MIKKRDFSDVIEWRENRAEENTLHIYGNNQVDAWTIKNIVESGRWEELQSLDGFFAGAYETADTAYLFCDRMGLFPLFYYRQNGHLFASPSVPDILALIEHNPSCCLEAVVSLLLFGHHISDETVIDGIKRCKGGTTVKIGTTVKQEKQIVWMGKHTYLDEPSLTASEMGDLFVNEVQKSVGKDKNVALALSGGFDSRAVLGALLECVGTERIETLIFGDKDSYDRKIAQLVANKAGVKNSVFTVKDQVFEKSFLRERSGNYGYGYSAFASQPKSMLLHISEISKQGSLLFFGVGGDAISGTHLHAGDLNLEPCESYESLASLLISKRCFLPLNVVCKIVGLDKSEVVSLVGRLIERSVLGRYDKPWKFLDAWDIYVRGRMELISVLPLTHETWRCPHFGLDYFRRMSIQCFQEKYNQNMYRKMLSSRFGFLFSLPSRRLKGRSLIGGYFRDLPWIMRWRAGRLPQTLKETVGLRPDGIGRNYGPNRRFLAGISGRNLLRGSIEILTQKSALRSDPEEILAICAENIQAALMLITLGYAFEPRQ